MVMQIQATNLGFLLCAVSSGSLRRKQHSSLYINLRNAAVLNTTDSQPQKIKRLWEYLNFCFLPLFRMCNGQSERDCTSEDVLPALEWRSTHLIPVLRLQCCLNLGVWNLRTVDGFMDSYAV